MNIISHPSPNFNDRPNESVIDTVVIHYTDMEDSRVSLERLCDPKAEVSSHYLIDEDGTIYQLVADEKRAWHAGVSHWNGKDNVNNFSIGIELQNHGHNYFLLHGHWPPYPLVQLESLVALLKDLSKRYPIRHITGHSDVSPNRKPEPKRDPGPHFDWNWLEGNGFGRTRDRLFRKTPRTLKGG